MDVSFSTDQERAVNVACEMYKTAAILNQSGMATDANAVAAKAKTLINTALEEQGKST